MDWFNFDSCISVSTSTAEKEFCDASVAVCATGNSTGEETLYVLSNPSMPGIYKVGMTRRDTDQRIKELYSTGVPTPFDTVKEYRTDDALLLEQRVHRELSRYRVNVKREFFKCDLNHIVNVIEGLL